MVSNELLNEFKKNNPEWPFLTGIITKKRKFENEVDITTGASSTIKDAFQQMIWNNSNEHEQEVLLVFQTRMNATMLDKRRTRSLFQGSSPELYSIKTNVSYPQLLNVQLPDDLVIGKTYLCAQPAGSNHYPDGVAFRFLDDTTVRFIYIEAKQSDTRDSYAYTCNSIHSRPRHQKRHVWVVDKQAFLGTALCTKEQQKENFEEQKFLDTVQAHIRKKRKTTCGAWVDHRAAGLKCSVKSLDFKTTSADVERYLAKHCFI